MFCLILSVATLVCGLLYLFMGYEIPVGWVQIGLGALCITLVLVWFAAKRKDKKVQHEEPRRG